MEKGKGKGGKRGRVEKNGGGGERVRHGFVGWTPLGLGFQIKSPKYLAASQPTGGGYAVERDRREGKEGMRGDRKKDLAEGPRGL